MGNVSKHLSNDLFSSIPGVDPFAKDDSTATLPSVHPSQLEGLNEGQTEMVMGINEYLTTNKNGLSFYMVQGGGGTGKSYSIKRAVSHLPKSAIIAAAPSHFAKNVLHDFLGGDIKTVTIASLLGMVVSYDTDTGETILIERFKRGKKPIDFKKVIIIDEGSMVTDEVVSQIVDDYPDKKIIVLGDYAQLPPVGQDHDSRFFNHISSELVQPMRFTGPIYEITQYIRDEINKIRRDEPANLHVINMTTDRISKVMDNGSGYIFMQNNRSMLKLAIRLFKMHRGANYVRLIAYRNATIDMLNKTIRESLYGSSSNQFEDGEILINDGGYNPNGTTSDAITNGQIFKVESIKEVEGPFGIPCVSLAFQGVKFNFTVYVVSTEGRDTFEKIEDKIKKMALADKSRWAQLREFRESFAHFSYAYAVSSHKVQGSTIQHAFVLEGDILEVKPTTLKAKLQSLYTSISRAAYRVYIFNKRFKVDNTAITKEILRMDG